MNATSQVMAAGVALGITFFIAAGLIVFVAAERIPGGRTPLMKGRIE